MRYESITFLFLILLINFSTPVKEELDLREANVINVMYSEINNQEYNFVVTLYHDDDGENGYADSGQVEELDGTILGTRILTHAHGTVEFTREQIIPIPEKVTFVVIRGHDQTHGFGGQIIILNMKLAVLEYINQGGEPLDFSNYEINSTAIVGVQSTRDKNTSTSDTNFTILMSIITILPINSFAVKRSRN